MIDTPELSMITKRPADVNGPADEPEGDDVKLFALEDDEASKAFWKLAGHLLDEHQGLLVIPVDADVSGLLAEIREFLAAERADLDALFEEVLRRRRPLSDRRLLQAKRLAEAKQELLERYGVRSSADLAAVNSRAKNPSQTAYRWTKAGKIFSVPFQGKDLYPGFQFDESSRPLPAIGKVLAVLGEYDLKPWDLAFWFITPTGWLGDRAPVEVLDDPGALVTAARSTYEPATF